MMDATRIVNSEQLRGASGWWLVGDKEEYIESVFFLVGERKGKSGGKGRGKYPQELCRKLLIYFPV